MQGTGSGPCRASLPGRCIAAAFAFCTHRHIGSSVPYTLAISDCRDGFGEFIDFVCVRKWVSYGWPKFRRSYFPTYSSFNETLVATIDSLQSKVQFTGIQSN
ncbi:MAG: hypothetical protein ABI552_01565 [Casimicrobiaceae bacterium]